MKKRLDLLMVERALAPSREKAKAYIMSGDVYVDGQKEDKAGTMFKETVKIEVRGNTLPYVSRGGLKLEKAMNNFGVSLDGKVCMDVGASTAGSRTTPFFPTFSLPASNCGLIRQTISPSSVRRFLTGRSTFVREMKETSIDENCAGSCRSSGST